jgi:sugar/nucleoside kinase (ribokinase family)
MAEVVGFFVGNLVVDLNASIPDGLPPVNEHGEIDAKFDAYREGRFAGGSATNAAIVFGALAKLDKSNGGGMAHLYTHSTLKTRDEIRLDLEDHNVHLKKTDVVDDLQVNINFAQRKGGKMLVRLKDYSSSKKNPLKAFNAARGALQQLQELLSRRNDPEATDLLDQTQGALRRAFEEVSDIVPQPAANWSSQFSTDLAGSSIIMRDLYNIKDTIRAGNEGKKHNIPVVLDLGRWDKNAIELIRNSTIVLASHDFTLPGRSKMTAEEILDFLDAQGIKKAAVTRGSKNTLFYDYDDPHAQGYYRGEIIVPPAPKIVDTSAAGDIHKGVFCYEFARGKHMGEALWQANRVSAFCVAFPEKRRFLEYLDFDAAGNLIINSPFDYSEPAPTAEI